MKTDRDRQRLTCRWPLAGLLPLSLVLAGFAVFAVFAVCTPFAFHRSPFAVRRSPLTVCSVQCAVCSVQCAVCSVQCAVCSVQCAVCSVQCAVCSSQFAVCRLPFVLFRSLLVLFRSPFAVRRLPFTVGRVPCAVCRVPCAMCRLPCAVRSWLRPDFVDDARAVKLRTAQFGSRHTGRCIAYLLDFIYLELASVSKYFAEALGRVNLFTKFFDGVHSVNVACTHDFEFLDDVTRLWLCLQKF